MYIILLFMMIRYLYFYTLYPGTKFHDLPCLFRNSSLFKIDHLCKMVDCKLLISQIDLHTI
ncbi:MAG: hypothetical protein A2283_18070 [Lentisphaerae bacterium RIFOXYA12_FULL_48_11]|nr:MAG: hypothetical protein A2283_18070 [Lentisphaerae bacterium RIFOXYA12_FULL_48_11]